MAVIKSIDTAIHSAKLFDAIGIGQDLARYIGSKLYRPDLTIDKAAALAAYILEEAKQNIEGCGGASQIICLTEDGSLKYLPVGHLIALRAWLAMHDFPDLDKMPSTIPKPLLLPVAS